MISPERVEGLWRKILEAYKGTLFADGFVEATRQLIAMLKGSKRICRGGIPFFTRGGRRLRSRDVAVLPG